MNLKDIKKSKTDEIAKYKRNALSEETTSASIASTVVPLGGTISRWGQVPKRGDRKKKGR